MNGGPGKANEPDTVVIFYFDISEEDYGIILLGLDMKMLTED
jgi:hypothetical protein